MPLLSNFFKWFGADSSQTLHPDGTSVVESVDPMTDMIPKNEAGWEVRLDHKIEPNSSYKTVVFDAAAGINSMDYRSNGSLLSELLSGISDKVDYRNLMDSIKDYDYVETIIRDLATDVLTKSYDPSAGPFFNFTIYSEKYKELEPLVRDDIDRLQIYPIMFDIIEDILLYGQYVLKLDVDHDELDDSVVQTAVLPAYSKGKMKKIFCSDANYLDPLRNNLNTQQNDEPINLDKGILADPRGFLTFTLFSSYRRVNIQAEDGSFYALKIPKGIIPASLVAKINALRLLESLQPLLLVQSLDEKMFFYINFPEGTDVRKAYAEARRYEKLLKSILSLDDVSTLSVNSLIDKISTVKVVPLFGNQQTVDAKTLQKPDKIDLEQINDLRNSISSALKIKINGDNSTNTEYFKLVKRIRTILCQCLSLFLKSYISMKYKISLESPDFELTAPDIYGIEDLDTIEYINLNSGNYRDILGLLGETTNSLNELSQSPYFDMDKVIESFRGRLSKISGIDLLKTLTPDELEKIKKKNSEGGEDLGSEYGSTDLPEEKPSKDLTETPEVTDSTEESTENPEEV